MAAMPGILGSNVVRVASSSMKHHRPRSLDPFKKSIIKSTLIDGLRPSRIPPAEA